GATTSAARRRCRSPAAQQGIRRMKTDRRLELPEFQQPDSSAPQQQSSGLRKDAEHSLAQYFSHLGDETVTNLYELVLHEVEAPLLEAVLRHTGSNQKIGRAS